MFNLYPPEHNSVSAQGCEWFYKFGGLKSEVWVKIGFFYFYRHLVFSNIPINKKYALKMSNNFDTSIEYASHQAKSKRNVIYNYKKKKIIINGG